MPIPIGVLAQAGAGGGGGLTAAYEHIETITTTGSTWSFSSIPQTFKHLELRWSVQADYPTYVAGELQMRFNGDTASNYYTHWLRGIGNGSISGVQNGFSGADTALRLGQVNGSQNSNYFAMGFCQILNYTDTQVFTTVKTLTGMVNGVGSNDTERASIYSGYWSSASAITSISIFTGYSAHISNSRVSLYGIKG